VLAFRNGTAFDAVSGQEWVFEVAEFQREVDRWKQSLGTLPAARRPGADPDRTVRGGSA
jgi:hypothetical protein